MDSKKKKKIVKIITIVGITVVVIGGVWYVLKRKYNSLEEVKDLGNILKDGGTVELEPGRKIFIPEIDCVSFVNENELRGVSISPEGFVKEVAIENLESATGSYEFNGPREGRILNFRVKEVLSLFKALKIGAKTISGYIPLEGKIRLKI